MGWAKAKRKAENSPWDFKAANFESDASQARLFPVLFRVPFSPFAFKSSSSPFHHAAFSFALGSRNFALFYAF
jgi:hypothetical protein